MIVEEFLAKRLLAEAGIPTPRGRLASTAEEAGQVAAEIGAVVVKAQVPAGRRGKAGGVRFADTPSEAAEAARALLGTELAGHRVERVLVEQRADIRRELYAAVLNDAASRGPLLLFSAEGGMEIEELHAAAPEKVLRLPLDIRRGLDVADARALLAGTDLGPAALDAVVDTLSKLYTLYRRVDAELLEVNPLVLQPGGGVRALDCKLSVDDAARPRQAELVTLVDAVARPAGTPLEERGRQEGFLFLELDGDVGILANGAGLTMATMDVVAHYGGRPANFLEIGGQAYTRAQPALELVLSNPRVRSLLINFCGAFARTDVMTLGVVEAIEALKPSLPISFSIHGTGEEEAIRLVRERLRLEPHALMDDAVKEAIAAAGPPGARSSLLSAARP